MSTREVFKERISIAPNEYEKTHLEVKIVYENMGFWDGYSQSKGFYLRITPVKIELSEDNSFNIVSLSTDCLGYKKFLHGCNRYSEKQKEKAINIMNSGIKKAMIDRILEDYGFKIMKGE